ncbi:hypothetical protein ACHAXM_005995 [Skeletonema potamos]
MEIQYQHQIPLAAVSFALFLAIIASIVAIWMFAYNINGSINAEEGNNTPLSTAEAPLGSAANPVVVDDDDDEHETTTNYSNNNNSHGISSILDRANNYARRTLQNLSPMHVMIGAGFVLPLAMAIPIFIEGGAAALFNDRNTLQLSMFALLAHSFMAVGAYRLLRQVLNGDVGTYPGMRRGVGGRRAARNYTVEDIATLVRKVPVEEFVSEEELKSGGCSISKMKRMLVNRGASDSLHRCVDRRDLLEEIEKVRKVNDDCTICAEKYEEGTLSHAVLIKYTSKETH